MTIYTITDERLEEVFKSMEDRLLIVRENYPKLHDFRFERRVIQYFQDDNRWLIEEECTIILPIKELKLNEEVLNFNDGFFMIQIRKRDGLLVPVFELDSTIKDSTCKELLWCPSAKSMTSFFQKLFQIKHFQNLPILYLSISKTPQFENSKLINCKSYQVLFEILKK